MANSIQIGPLEEGLVRGAACRIPIVVVLDRPTKVRGIRGRFRGAEETKAVYTTTSTDSKGHTTTHTHTAVETTEFVAHDYQLAGRPALGFFGNISDGVATMFGGGQHDVMEPGEYPYEVEATIPADAPPSHTGQKSRLLYELSVKVDIPLATDLTAVQSFELPPLPAPQREARPARSRYPDEQGRGLVDSLTMPNVELEVALRADRYQLGEEIEGLLCVDTAKALNCRRVWAQLVAVETSQAHGHHDSHQHVGQRIEIDTPGQIEGSYSARFTLPAEVEAPLSATGNRFHVQWFVQISLDVPWAKDPSIRVPIELVRA